MQFVLKLIPLFVHSLKFTFNDLYTVIRIPTAPDSSLGVTFPLMAASVMSVSIVACENSILVVTSGLDLVAGIVDILMFRTFWKS